MIPKNQAKKEVGNLKGTNGYGAITSKPMPQRMLSDSGQANEPFGLYKWLSFDSFFVAQQNRMKEALLNKQTTFGRSSSQNQQDTAVQVGGSSYLAAFSVQVPG
ncbi:hypothetical protein L6164_034027 [Bauhinia variegata]|uniref:Uncharacterized protein n=1 Tax=Bauhinia variegata TaxID=167791 RepID=A0ACB9KTY9_BAUVA|nr:hypothetical protein L6164_034027 [Bauhinia variegata]